MKALTPGRRQGSRSSVAEDPTAVVLVLSSQVHDVVQPAKLLSVRSSAGSDKKMPLPNSWQGPAALPAAVAIRLADLACSDIKHSRRFWHCLAVPVGRFRNSSCVLAARPWARAVDTSSNPSKVDERS